MRGLGRGGLLPPTGTIDMSVLRLRAINSAYNTCHEKGVPFFS